MKNSETIINTITHQLGGLNMAEVLFDHVPEIVFFVKDTNGQYLMVNQTLVLRCGAKEKADLIGCKATEVFGTEVGKHYEQQDRKVINNQQAIIKQLESHLYPTQEMGWCLTTKVPLLNDQSQCTGLVGISQDLNWTDLSEHFLQHVSKAMNYAETHLQQNPSIADMADAANLSCYQLDRRMKALFGITTGKWLLKTKISKASQLLINSEFSVLDIALAVGYNDQSAFTRQFKTATGLTPSAFKKRQRNERTKPDTDMRKKP